MANLEEFEKKTYYELLGVEETASTAEIKEAYREIARVYHPDSNFFDELIEDCLSDQDNKVFRLVTAAYNTLIKEAERSAYNQKLNYRKAGPEVEERTANSDQFKASQPLRPAARNFGVFVEEDQAFAQQQTSTKAGPYCRFGMEARAQAEIEQELERAELRKARLIRAVLLVVIFVCLPGMIYCVMSSQIFG